MQFTLVTVENGKIVELAHSPVLANPKFAQIIRDSIKSCKKLTEDTGMPKYFNYAIMDDSGTVLEESRGWHKVTPQRVSKADALAQKWGARITKKKV